MTKSLRNAVTLTVLGLMPVAAGAQRVRSYSLKPATGAEDPRVNERVTDAIARGLALRGIRVSDENPEVQIIPSLTVQRTPQVTTYNNGWGPPAWYWASGWGVTTVKVQNVQQDTLVIDMVDAKTGQLLWRGRGVRQVNPQWRRDKIDREVNEMVAKVLRNLPSVPDR
jgi:hypothetical protein